MKISSIAKQSLMLLLFSVIVVALYTGVCMVFGLVFQSADSASERAYQYSGQPFTQDKYLQGRNDTYTVSAVRASDGTALLSGAPDNLSPDSEKLSSQIKSRVAQIRKNNPAKADEAVPVDLVTSSASGIDPDISPAAAEYQVARIAKARGLTEEQVRSVIEKHTTRPALGFIGEACVNVSAVNAELDTIK